MLVTNGSMQADAFLFEHLVRAGRRRDRRAPHLRPHAALAARTRRRRCTPVELEPDGIDTRGARAAALGGRGRAPKLAHIIPNFQNPAGYTLSLPKRERLLALAARARLPGVRGRPLCRRFASAGSRCRRCSRWTPSGGVRVVVLEDGVPGDPRGLPGRAARADRGDRARSPPTPTSPRTWSPSRSCTSSAPRERSSARSRPSGRRSPSAPHAGRGAAPRAGRGRVRGAAGRLLHVGHAAARDRRARSVRRWRRARRDIREGHRLHARGGENTLRLAYSGVTPEQIDEGVARLAEAYRSL